MVQEVDIRHTSWNRPPSLGELRSRRDAILDLLEGPVDVVTPAALQERVRIKVLREAVPL